MIPRMQVISGMGAKAAACFLVETPGPRFLFDLGAVGGLGGTPDLTGVGPVDAVLLSHLHPDHAAALPHCVDLGAPLVYTSDLTANALGLADWQSLPLQGTTQICGMTITCGRNGHAPSGVWLHLGLGDGFLYCGDMGLTSAVYPFDPPPPAATVVLDASFATAEAPARSPVQALAAVLAEVSRDGGGPLLLPAPAWGRGVELALAAAGLGAPLAIDTALRRAIAEMVAVPGAILSTAAAALPALADAAEPAETARPRPGLIVLIDDAAARGALAAKWISRINTDGGAIRFTGHCPPGSPAAQLVAAGQAGSLAWPVHPWLSENRDLLASCQASRAIAAFCGPEAYGAIAQAIAPVALLTRRDIAL